MIDRNKSLLTHQITRATINWLDNHGFKPIVTECWMPPMLADDGKPAKGWIADIAAVIVPTQTELINLKLIQRRPVWNRDNVGRSRQMLGFWRDSRDLYMRRMTCVVEVKTARSDFKKDRKWTQPIPADMGFIAVPSRMLDPEEWPANWGVLEARGSQLVKVRNPTVMHATEYQHLETCYQIALCMDHDVRYRRIREAQKKERIEHNGHTTSARIRDIVRVVAAIKNETGRNFEVESIEQVCSHFGLRNIKDRDLQLLADVFGIPAKSPESELS